MTNEKPLSEKAFNIETARRRGGNRYKQKNISTNEGYRNLRLNRFYYKDVREAVLRLKKLLKENNWEIYEWQIDEIFGEELSGDGGKGK